MSDPVVLLSTGDVVGPAGGVTNNSMVLFDGTSGKKVKGNNAVVTAAGLALLDDVDAAAQRTTLQLKTGAVTNKTTFNTDPTVGSLIKVGDFGVGGMLDLRGTIFVTGKPQDLYSKGFVKGFADGGPAGLAIPGLVSTSFGVLELDAHWSEPSGAGGIMRSFTQGYSGIVYTQTMVNATTWGPWIATWNTSNLVKTVSSTDTTAGSMLKVGDFGLGTIAVHYGGDLNLLGNVTGFYRTIAGATNLPNGCLDACFVHIGSGDTYSQTIVGYNSNRMYTRGGVGVVPNISWLPWREIAPTDSPAFTGIPTAPTASVGTGTTQVATTAFVNAEIANDALSIWGGTVTGRTVLQKNGQVDWTTAEVEIGAPDGGQAILTFHRHGVEAGTLRLNGGFYFDSSVTSSGAVKATNLFGQGQTWQDVTSSRTPGVIYTNTSGRPISVKVTHGEASSYNRLSVDGLVVDESYLIDAAAMYITVSAIVPSGSTYQLFNTGEPGAYVRWMELR